MTDINITKEILEYLEAGSPLILSVSGGKDSDAMSWKLLEYHQQQGFSGDIVMVHSDLGRMEWKSTPDYVNSLEKRLGLPLYVVKKVDKHGNYIDLLDGIKRRMVTRPEVVPFPSPAMRWCTSDWKRAPISKWIRNAYKEGVVICAMGIRAEESPARSKRNVVEVRKDCTTKSGSRVTFNWNPILSWGLDDVWNTIYDVGDGEFHPAYKIKPTPNERLSCAICIMGSRSDIINGARANPELLEELVTIEESTGYTFQHNLSLRDIKTHIQEE